ncbi:hypothetical protein Hanom_Chr03g00232251 [Helianthus anomalus]
MHEKKLRYWFVKDGKIKRTPKVSPAVTAPKKTTPKIVVNGKDEMGSHIKEPTKKKSPPRLVDEPVIDPTELIKQGADLLNMSYDQYIKQTDDAAKAKAAKVQGPSVEKVTESSANNVEPESVKEKDAEGVAYTDSN